MRIGLLRCLVEGAEDEGNRNYALDVFPHRTDGSRESSLRVHAVLLWVAYGLTAPFVFLVTPLYVIAKRDASWEWLGIGGPLILALVLWVVGVVLGFALRRKHPLAAVRIARYLVIVVALIALYSTILPALPLFIFNLTR